MQEIIEGFSIGLVVYFVAKGGALLGDFFRAASLDD